MDFHKINECNSNTLTTTCRISLPIPKRLSNKRSDSQLIYLTLKIHFSNGKKSGFHTKSKEVRFDTKEFTFIGMEFLTGQKIVRVPANRVKVLILTIKTILSQTQVSAQTFLSLFGKFSAAADLILLSRLHLQSLQMCLLSVWKPHNFSLDHKVMINSMIKFYLKWWTDTN